jgi:DNA mismatch repair protein MutS
MDTLDLKNLTPMMKQFYSIKEKYQDYIIFFRAGDFYEMFDSDAEEASNILNIVLTQRAGYKMCGVPYHSYKPYLKKLLDNGKKVAICEQLEDPKTAKGIVKRGVVEIYTPGMIINDEFLSKENNFILHALYYVKDNFYIYSCWADISTGEIYFSTKYDCESFIDTLLMIKPKELILTEVVNYQIFEKIDLKINLDKENIQQDNTSRFKQVEKDNNNFIEKNDLIKKNNLKEEFLKNIKEKVYFAGLNFFKIDLIEFEKNDNFNYYKNLIVENLKIKKEEEIYLDNKYFILSTGILFDNFKKNHISNLKFFQEIKIIEDSFYLEIDEQTSRNLEIFFPLFSNEKDTTIIKFLDYTSTSLGRRKLKEVMLYPLKNADNIKERLSYISELLGNFETTNILFKEIKKIKDIERLFVKIYLGKANPIDLISLKTSFYVIHEINNILNEKFEKFKNFIKISPKIYEYLELIDKAIVDEPPVVLENGGVIKEGFSQELDDLIKLNQNSEQFLVEYAEKLKSETNIQNLKIKYNKVFGYFIEISKGNINRVPNYFIRKQTLTNYERFTTEYLIQLESNILNCFEKRLNIEKKIFSEICEKIKDIKIFLEDVFEKIGFLDLYISFTIVAKKYNFTKPEFTLSKDLIIEDGFHPIVKKFIEEQNKEQFITNDLKMNDKKFFHVITGPNMSGKSTFLRQNAIIIYLAHIGSFVPAKRVVLPIFDKIFCRVGASDNIARGQSTFLNEMLETANILKNATHRSFIILDEVGRGTSTFDGMSLAFAISEYIINKIKAKTLFATHYHELIHLDENAEVECYHTVVKEWGDKIIFLKKIEKGYSDKSYGIYVAKLAGIPFEVIERATNLLNLIKENDIRFDFEIKKKKEQNFLFDFYENEKEIILNSILNFDIYNTTPAEWFKFLEQIKDKIKKLKEF